MKITSSRAAAGLSAARQLPEGDPEQGDSGSIRARRADSGAPRRPPRDHRPDQVLDQRCSSPDITPELSDGKVCLDQMDNRAPVDLAAGRYRLRLNAVSLAQPVNKVSFIRVRPFGNGA